MAKSAKKAARTRVRLTVVRHFCANCGENERASGCYCYGCHADYMRKYRIQRKSASMIGRKHD